jgi:hypothetical protein
VEEAEAGVAPEQETMTFGQVMKTLPVAVAVEANVTDLVETMDLDPLEEQQQVLLVPIPLLVMVEQVVTILDTQEREQVLAELVEQLVKMDNEDMRILKVIAEVLLALVGIQGIDILTLVLIK